MSGSEEEFGDLNRDQLRKRSRTPAPPMNRCVNNNNGNQKKTNSWVSGDGVFYKFQLWLRENIKDIRFSEEYITDDGKTICTVSDIDLYLKDLVKYETNEFKFRISDTNLQLEYTSREEEVVELNNMKLQTALLLSWFFIMIALSLFVWQNYGKYNQMLFAFL